jgi:DNA polymerase III, epsilon subunit and related 3''-5'' exonucleases
MRIEHVSDTEYEISDLFVERLHERRFCIFDLEATGPDPEQDRVTQIGAVRVSGGGIEPSPFVTLVRPPIPIPAPIERLTGIRNEDAAGAPLFPEAYRAFTAYAADRVLVTQAGYEYDGPLLERECGRHGLDPPGNLLLDTKVLFAHAFPEIDEIPSTDFLIRFFGIDDGDLRRHDALGDAHLIARILIRLLAACRERGIDGIRITEPLRVKKMRLRPLN